MPAAIEWTAELEQAIINWIAEGKTLREFCRQPGMPSHDAVYDHEKINDSFKQRIACARTSGEDLIAQECLHIADTTEVGVIITEKPDGTVETKRADMIEHRKLRIDTRLKLLAKWNPRKWGEKVELGGSLDVAVKRVLTDV